MSRRHFTLSVSPIFLLCCLLFALIGLSPIVLRAEGLDIDKDTLKTQLAELAIEKIIGGLPNVPEDKLKEATYFNELVSGLAPLGVKLDKTNFSEAALKIYNTYKEAYEKEKDPQKAKQKVKDLLKGDVQNLIFQSLDEGSQEVLTGLNGLLTDAQKDLKAILDMNEELEDDPKADYAALLKKYGVKGETLDKFEKMEGAINAGVEKFGDYIKAGGIIYSGMTGTDKIDALFELGTEFGGKVPIIGKFVQLYFTVAKGMADAVGRLAKILEKRQEGCVGGIGDHGKTNVMYKAGRNERAIKFDEQFGSSEEAGESVCPIDMTKQFYRDTYANDRGAGTQLYFWNGDEFIKANPGGGGLASLKALRSWLRLNGHADKSSNMEFMVEAYNITPGFGERKKQHEEMAKEINSLIKKLSSSLNCMSAEEFSKLLWEQGGLQEVIDSGDGKVTMSKGQFLYFPEQPVVNKMLEDRYINKDSQRFGLKCKAALDKLKNIIPVTIRGQVSIQTGDNLTWQPGVKIEVDPIDLVIKNCSSLSTTGDGLFNILVIKNAEESFSLNLTAKDKGSASDVTAVEISGARAYNVKLKIKSTCEANEELDVKKGICVCIKGFENFAGICVPVCKKGKTRDDAGECVKECKPEEELIDGKCVPACREGEARSNNGKCLIECKLGQELIDGKCVPPCKEGETRDKTGKCLIVCKPGQELINGKCVPACNEGATRDKTGKCKDAKPAPPRQPPAPVAPPKVPGPVAKAPASPASADDSFLEAVRQANKTYLNTMCVEQCMKRGSAANALAGALLGSDAPSAQNAPDPQACRAECAAKYPVPQITVRIEAPKTKLRVGETLKLLRWVMGGNPPYTETWTGATQASVNTAEFTSKNVGTFTVSLKISDAGTPAAVAEASVTLTVGDIEVVLTGLPAGPVVVGSEVKLGATLTSGGLPVQGSYTLRWQPHPEAQFTPFESGTSRSTAVKFQRPGAVRVWVVVLAREGEVLKTVAESAQATIEVVEPTLKLKAVPEFPYVGQEVKLVQKEEPAVPDDLISFWWEIKGDALHAGALQNEREYTFVPKSEKPVTVTVHGKARADGSVLGEASLTVTPKPYAVRVSSPLRQGPPPLVWSERQKGLVPAPASAIGTSQDVSISVTVSPEPPGQPLRYQWSVNPAGCTLSNPTGRETRANASAKGSYQITVQVSDKDGIVLGSGSGTISVTVSQDDQVAGPGVGKAQEKLSQARAAVAAGKLDEGIGLAGEAAALDPKNPDAHNQQARWQGERQQVQQRLDQMRLALGRKDLKAAAGDLAATQQLHPHYAPVLAAAAEYEQAAAAAKDKEAAKLLRAQGETLQGQGKLGEAVGKYQESLKYFPDPSLEAHIAKLEAEMARLEQQRQAKDTARRLRSEGETLQGQGDLGGAVGKYQESLKYFPDPSLEAHIAKLEAEIARTNNASRNKEIARQLRAEGAALQQAGRVREAIGKYRESLVPWPDPRIEEHIRTLESSLAVGTRQPTVAPERPPAPAPTAAPVRQPAPAPAAARKPPAPRYDLNGVYRGRTLIGNANGQDLYGDVSLSVSQTGENVSVQIQITGPGGFNDSGSAAGRIVGDRVEMGDKILGILDGGRTLVDPEGQRFSK